MPTWNSRAIPERARDAEPRGRLNRPCVAVEFVILAGVDDVEAGGPESDRGGQPQDARIERRRAPRSTPPPARCPRRIPARHVENDVNRLVNE